MITVWINDYASTYVSDQPDGINNGVGILKVSVIVNCASIGEPIRINKYAMVIDCTEIIKRSGVANGVKIVESAAVGYTL